MGPRGLEPAPGPAAAAERGLRRPRGVPRQLHHPGIRRIRRGPGTGPLSGRDARGACGSLAQALFPAGTADPGGGALIGTAAFFAASAKAPVTSILLLLEMTRDYRILPPVLAAIAGSVRVSHRLSRFSIYTLKLHRG